jgi:uncharacterized membrane protein YhaH (DUF805 family)
VQGLTIQDAVRSVLAQYIGFSGRARRSEYWYWVLAAGIVGLVLFILGLAAKIFLVLYYIWALAILLPNIGVLMRRLHDTDRSGWWIFIGIIPIVGAIVLIVFTCQDSTPGDNRYGPSPKHAG